MQVVLARRFSPSGQASNLCIWLPVRCNVWADSIHQALSVRVLRNQTNRLKTLALPAPTITKRFHYEPCRRDAAEGASPTVWRDAVLRQDIFDEFAYYANQEGIRFFACADPKGSRKYERFEAAFSPTEI